jgi:N-formylglutamate amidohydrolase
MPSSAITHVAHAGSIDIVLGDRFGASCSNELTTLVEDMFRAEGLHVVRNKPYAGGFITQNQGAPQHGRHALQIEINRGLYLNEATLEKSRNFASLQAIMDHVVGELLDHLTHELSPQLVAAE